MAPVAAKSPGPRTEYKRANVRPHDALLGLAPGSTDLHDLGDEVAIQTIPGLVAYRFYGPLMFANVRYFIERIEYFIANETTPVRQLIVHARAISDIDVTAAEQLHAFFQNLRTRGITVALPKAQLSLREAARHMGFDGAFAAGVYYPKFSAAVASYLDADRAPPP